MKQLRYEITIGADAEEVWHTIIGPETYNQWVKAFSPNSRCEGEWKQNAEMKFYDPDFGRTFATLTHFEPFEKIVAEHTATLSKEGVRETTGEMTEKWIGTEESYLLNESNGQTTLVIDMKTDAAFEDMFNNAWPKALENIKSLVETGAIP